MYNTSGVQSYQNIGVESAVMNASPHQLIVMLFDGAHSALIRARLFLDAGQLAEKGRAFKSNQYHRQRIESSAERGGWRRTVN